jgi:hypothetical protein
MNGSGIALCAAGLKSLTFYLSMCSSPFTFTHLPVCLFPLTSPTTHSPSKPTKH